MCLKNFVNDSIVMLVACILLSYIISTGCDLFLPCPCLSSSSKATYCWSKSLCNRWCKECQIKCPESLSGCVQRDQAFSGSDTFYKGPLKIRKKRQYDDYLFGTCPNLDSPTLGSMTCRQQNDVRTCSGRCLPGYSFEDVEEEEIFLTCRRGRWSPFSGFPDCIRGNSCRLEVEGAGFFNCTIGMEGTRCDVTCREVYMGRYRCYPGQGWNSVLPPCVRPQAEVSCSDPGLVMNADRYNMEGTGEFRLSYSPGQSIVYSCHSNYALFGSSRLTCLPTGSWSHRRPRCEPIPSTVIATEGPMEVSCRPPQSIENGRINTDNNGTYQRFPAGSMVQYACNDGYDLIGDSRLYCLNTGEWSEAPPSCREAPMAVSCRPPQSIENGRINTDNNSTYQRFPAGSMVQYACNDGYDLIGDSRLYCLNTGEWSEAPPSCREIAPEVTCWSLPPIENGQMISTSLTNRAYPPRSVVQFMCNRGYDLLGENILYCLSTGEWSSASPTCIENAPEVLCRPLQTIENGQIVSTLFNNGSRLRFPAGSMVQYDCNEGYDLIGETRLFCLNTGEWSAEPPTCTDVTEDDTVYCENPGPISNGRFRVLFFLDVRQRPISPSENEDEYPEGTRLEYFCEGSYVLRGSQIIICENSGYWSANIPSCVEDCGRSLLKSTHRIINGSVTLAGEWPWVVAISIRDGNISTMICGGALLDSRTVLTAAHCLTGEPRFTLYFGKFFRRDRFDDRKVRVRTSSRLVPHPNYDSDTYESDIAIMKFSPRVRYSDRIQPICLPSPLTSRVNLQPETFGYVTGWGLTETNLPSDRLMMASLPVQPDDVCVQSFEAMGLPERIKPGMFCAGLTKGVTGACTGDSGSPLVFYDETSERFTVEGVVSFSVIGRCAAPDSYTVFTRVSDFMTWILRNM